MERRVYKFVKYSKNGIFQGDNDLGSSAEDSYPMKPILSDMTHHFCNYEQVWVRVESVQYDFVSVSTCSYPQGISLSDDVWVGIHSSDGKNIYHEKRRFDEIVKIVDENS